MAEASPNTWHNSKTRHSVPFAKLGPPYPGAYALVFVITFAVAWFSLYAIAMRREIAELKRIVAEEARLREQFHKLADVHQIGVNSKRLDRLERAIGLPPMEDPQ